MTKIEVEHAINSGARVEAGEGDDHDTGRIMRLIDDMMAEVAWDSGVRTPCPIADLSLI